ncbi:hypothetical protein D9M68_711970 [compost metagenome]
MARLLDFQFGNQLEYVDHPAEALVAAVEGDDEVFFDTLAGAAGQQAADLLQRLAHLDGEKVIAHQPADRFAREQVGGEGLQQHLRERVAVDDANRLLRLVEHRQGVEVGLHTERLQYLGGRGAQRHGRLHVEQGGQVAAFVAQGRWCAVELRQQVARITWRLFLRAAEQIALQQIDAHFRKHGEFFLQLDAFGDHFGPRGLGHLQDRADELAFDRIQVDAIDEVPIDLHVVRAQFRPHAQARVAGAEVVEGNRKAHGAVVVQGGVEQVEVVGWRLLGQFDNHLAWRYAKGLQ